MSKTASKLKQTVAIIGPGRLGSALAIALERSNYQVESLVGKRCAQVKRSAQLLDAPVRVLDAKQFQQLSIPDLLIITTPDDQISAVVHSLSKLELTKKAHPVVLHTSGALSSTVLQPLAARHWSIGSIHPLVSVSEPLAGARALRGCYWCVEGDAQALRLSRRIVRDLDGRSFSIKKEHKTLYHAAAVMSSGHVVALFDVAIDLLSACGLTRSEARKVLLPLLNSTFKNLVERSPAQALTGTFARGDLATLNQHLDALAPKHLKNAEALYRLLGLKASKLAKQNGLDRTVARLMEDELKTAR